MSSGRGGHWSTHSGHRRSTDELLSPVLPGPATSSPGAQSLGQAIAQQFSYITELKDG